MDRPDFVREMKDALAEQKQKAELDQREKLHDGDVIDKQGMRKWEELHQEVKSLSEQIGVGFWPLEGYSFRLRNGKAELDVRLDGAIKYSGVANGTFTYAVVGSDLQFSQEDKIGTGSLELSVSRIGETLRVSEVAEKLVRMIVRDNS